VEGGRPGGLPCVASHLPLERNLAAENQRCPGAVYLKQHRPSSLHWFSGYIVPQLTTAYAPNLFGISPSMLQLSLAPLLRPLGSSTTAAGTVYMQW
jgi:hypothetical protein